MHKQLQIPNQVLVEFREYLNNQSFNQEPVNLYEPINYFMGIGGKRLRPVVLLLSSYLFNGKYRDAMPAALSLEVFHNFTLVHDDIMDDAPLRRGHETMHEKYDINTSILSGDVMVVHAFNLLLQLKDKTAITKIMEIFTKQAIEVCEGQQMDMDFEQEDEVSIDRYLKMIELKTSVLVGAAMQIGAILGGADDEESNSMYQFGRNLGIAFQIQDDFLDTYGDPKKFGKKVGGDIIQNKKTILYLKALESANDLEKSNLQELYNSNTLNEREKVSRVKKVFDSLNIQEEVNRMKELYQKTAFEYLEKLKVDEGRKDVMKQFALALMDRQS